MKRSLYAALGAALLSGVANAQFIIDGSKDAAYPASTTFQSNFTQFGDSTTGTRQGGGGSELDGLFAEFQPGFLNIIFTGNLETNNNNLELFFDVDNGGMGQNTLRNDNADVDFNGLNRMAGLTFDAGFNADFYLVLNINGDGTLNVNYATLPSAGAGTGGYLGSAQPTSNGVLTGGTNPSGLLASYDNSNIGGVSGGNGGNTSDPSSVTTGIEFSIPTSLIGDVSYNTGVRITSFINGGGHGFVSNQTLGGLASGTENLGEPANVNFSNLAGNQFATVPEPASTAALALGLGGLLARRRRAKR